MLAKLWRGAGIRNLRKCSNRAVGLSGEGGGPESGTLTPGVQLEVGQSGRGRLGASPTARDDRAAEVGAIGVAGAVGPAHAVMTRQPAFDAAVAHQAGQDGGCCAAAVGTALADIAAARRFDTGKTNNVAVESQRVAIHDGNLVGIGSDAVRAWLGAAEQIA